MRSGKINSHLKLANIRLCVQIRIQFPIPGTLPSSGGDKQAGTVCFRLDIISLWP